MLDISSGNKLIFISPDKFFPNGGGVPYLRQALALDAVHNMRKRYNVEDDRVFVSGFSGGGLVASQLIHGFPDVFHGGFFINGEDLSIGHKAADKRLVPTTWELYEWSGAIDELKESLRLVVMTGEPRPHFRTGDFRRQLCGAAAGSLHEGEFLRDPGRRARVSSGGVV